MTTLLLFLSSTTASAGSSLALPPPSSSSSPRFEPSHTSSRNSGAAGIRLFDDNAKDNNDDESSVINNNNNDDIITTKTTSNASSSFHTLSPIQAATAMNSVDFLKELIKQKNTSNEIYFQEVDKGEGTVPRGKKMGRSVSIPPQPQQQSKQSVETVDESLSSSSSPERKQRMTNTCEYTGKLWFMRKRGIRFRETVRICTDDRGSSSSTTSSSSSVECLTKYKHKNEWVDCSKVICTFAIPPSPSLTEEGDTILPTRTRKIKKKAIATTTAGGGGTIVMKVDSEILLRAPLFGVNGAVKEKITKTFGSAAEAFYENFFKEEEAGGGGGGTK